MNQKSKFYNFFCCNGRFKTVAGRSSGQILYDDDFAFPAHQPNDDLARFAHHLNDDYAWTPDHLYSINPLDKLHRTTENMESDQATNDQPHQVFLHRFASEEYLPPPTSVIWGEFEEEWPYAMEVPDPISEVDRGEALMLGRGEALKLGECEELELSPGDTSRLERGEILEEVQDKTLDDVDEAKKNEVLELTVDTLLTETVEELTQDIMKEVLLEKLNSLMEDITEDVLDDSIQGMIRMMEDEILEEPIEAESSRIASIRNKITMPAFHEEKTFRLLKLARVNDALKTREMEELESLQSDSSDESLPLHLPHRRRKLGIFDKLLRLKWSSPWTSKNVQRDLEKERTSEYEKVRRYVRKLEAKDEKKKCKLEKFEKKKMDKMLKKQQKKEKNLNKKNEKLLQKQLKKTKKLATSEISATAEQNPKVPTMEGVHPAQSSADECSFASTKDEIGKQADEIEECDGGVPKVKKKKKKLFGKFFPGHGFFN